MIISQMHLLEKINKKSMCVGKIQLGLIFGPPSSQTKLFFETIFEGITNNTPPLHLRKTVNLWNNS